MRRRRHPVLAANLREAARSLARARLRTVLGLLGIMIGIASIIAMISTGEIATAQSRKQFESLGIDLLTISTRDEAPPGEGIALADALILAHEIPSITASAPVIRTSAAFNHAGKPVGNGSIQGVTATFAALNKLDPARGRFISDLDIERMWCVVGADIAQAMRRAGTLEVLGATIEMKGRFFEVAGELKAREESYGLPYQVEADRSVFIPITTARRIAPEEPIKLIVARADVQVHHEQAVADVSEWFAERAPGLELEINSPKQLIAQMESQLALMTMLLGAVGSISLIVGGIGVMNIMLVTVSERRTEIGVRRAIGARRGDIQGQFLLEAIMLSALGGAFGVAAGIAVTWGVCQYTEWEFFVSTTPIAVGLGVSSSVGLFFGFQPAHQAARLDPIVALQGE